MKEKSRHFWCLLFGVHITTVLWDKEGNHVGLDSLFNNDKQREGFTTKFSEMRKNFPNEKTFSCPKK